VLAEIKRPHRIGDRQIELSGSIGIATFPDAGTDTEALLRHADQAMYRAKRYGRDNSQLFETAMASERVERSTVEARLPLE
jgi:diguanylate cyclase (GGDEF)-like protein